MRIWDYVQERIEGINGAAVPLRTPGSWSVPPGDQILSLRPDLQMNWQNITEVYCFQPSPRPMYKITTERGSTVTTTNEHGHLSLGKGGLRPICAQDLEVGMFVPVVRRLSIPRVTKSFCPIHYFPGATVLPKVVPLTPSFARMLGRTLIDTGVYEGVVPPQIRKVAQEITNDPKAVHELYKVVRRIGPEKIADFLFRASREIIGAFLEGYLSTKGSFVSSFGGVVIFTDTLVELDSIRLLLMRVGVACRRVPGPPSAILITNSPDIVSLANCAPALAPVLQTLVDPSSARTLPPGANHIIASLAECLGKRTKTKFLQLKAMTGQETTEADAWALLKTAKEEINSYLYPPAMQKVKELCNSDVNWEKIVSVSPVYPDCSAVCDLGVAGTNSFALLSGIILHSAPVVDKKVKSN